MNNLTSKELTMISDALNFEGLICRKARAYANTLTDTALAECFNVIADDHQRRYEELLRILGA